MKQMIQIRDTANLCSIDIEGTIGVPEAWQFDNPAERVATYQTFRDTVLRIGALEAERIVVNIRSTGGDVNDAMLIYEALTALPAHITTRCYGYTASAATIIAQAATEGCREISTNALYLVHRSACATEGNADQLEAHTELLRRTDERLAALYASRSGGSEEQFASLMAENDGTGRWLSPQEAVEAGLADVVVGTTPQKGTIAQNIVRGWQRLVASAGLTPPPSPDHNILHFDTDTELLAARSVVAAKDGQQGVGPTCVKACEDPSVHETTHSTNDNAYMADAKRFAKF